jgi:hypothetical protein
MSVGRREVREDQHGTPTGYTYGCRCRQCTLANRDRNRQYNAMPVVAHGRVGYGRGCRCDECYEYNQAASGAAQRRATPEGAASLDEVRQWGISLGLPLPSKGPVPQPLIDRWNREHPERICERKGRTGRLWDVGAS